MQQWNEKATKNIKYMFALKLNKKHTHFLTEKVKKGHNIF